MPPAKAAETAFQTMESQWRELTEAIPDTTQNAFLAMEAQWRDLVGSVPSVWEQDFLMMNAQQQALQSAGRWVGGPADLLGIIGRSRRETYHNAVLAWLMDPRGRHGFGSAFLERVLAECFPDDVAGGRVGDLAVCVVETEVSGPSSRADIIIESASLHLVVEVKVDAVEGHNQCQRLYDDHHTHHQARFVFLTPRGRRPRSCQPEVSESWAVLSFRQVRDLLADMVGAVEGLEAKATVRSYLATLQREFR